MFLAVVGLCCCTQAFFSYGEWGYSLHCGGFFCGAQALGKQASVVATHELSWLQACWIFPGQGSNLCPLHCKTNS